MLPPESRGLSPEARPKKPDPCTARLEVVTYTTTLAPCDQVCARSRHIKDWQTDSLFWILGVVAHGRSRGSKLLFLLKRLKSVPKAYCSGKAVRKPLS